MVDDVLVDFIFCKEDIQELRESARKQQYLIETIDMFYSGETKQKTNIDKEMLKKIADFNLKIFHFLEQTFEFSAAKLAKLLNAFNILLNLREDEEYQETKSANKNSSKSIDIKLTEESKEPNFNELARKKLFEFKFALIKVGLTEGDADLLTKDEILTILEYLNSFFFPYIKLTYNLIQIKKITFNEKNDIKIAIPLPVEPLKKALKLPSEVEESFREEPVETKQADTEKVFDTVQNEELPDLKHAESNYNPNNLFNSLVNERDTGEANYINEVVKRINREVDYHFEESNLNIDKKVEEILNTK